MITDPIADMLTRIRNASKNKFENVSMPTSKLKENIAEILKEEGYVSGFEVTEKDGKKTLVITLKYFEGASVISGVKRVSKPGLRIYANSDELPKVLNGLGIAIISTSKGLLVDREARKQNVGGEVVAYVW
jgi:small subunit ribosomal protein S8